MLNPALTKLSILFFFLSLFTTESARGETNVFDEQQIISDTEKPDYSKIDAYALSLKSKYRKIPELAKDLTSRYDTDEEKVRSIFIWITNNIAYDFAAFHSDNSRRVSFSYKTQEELNAKRKKYYQDYALSVLKKNKGICEGYAVLFQELCRESGIKCELVIGKVSNNTRSIKNLKEKKNFSTNHAWNKVLINNEWYHIDATWASGYCDKPVRKFYKEYNPYYYLSPVGQLYSTHAENLKETEKRNSFLQ